MPSLTESKTASVARNPSMVASKPSVSDEPSPVASSSSGIVNETSVISNQSAIVSKPSMASKPSLVARNPSGSTSKSSSMVNSTSALVSKSSVAKKASVVTSQPSVIVGESSGINDPSSVSKTSIEKKTSVVANRPSNNASKSSEISNPSAAVSKQSVPKKASAVGSRPSVIAEKSSEVSSPLAVASKPSTTKKASVVVSRPSINASKSSQISNPSAAAGKPSATREASVVTSRPSVITEKSSEISNTSEVASKPSITQKASIVASRPSVIAEKSSEISNPSAPASKRSIAQKESVIANRPSVITEKSSEISNPLAAASKPSTGMKTSVVVSRPSVIAAKSSEINNTSAVASKPSITQKASIAANRPSVISEKSSEISNPSTVVSKPSAGKKTSVIANRPSAIAENSSGIRNPSDVIRKPSVGKKASAAASRPSQSSKTAAIASGTAVTEESLQSSEMDEFHALDMQLTPKQGKPPARAQVTQEGYRDAMGEYHPPPSGKFLTGLMGGTPAPNQYQLPDLNITMRAAPGWYFGYERNENKAEEKTDDASPLSYAPINPPKCKHPLLTTLKSRIEPPNYNCAPPPNTYFIKNDDIGQKKSKIKIKSRPPPSCSIGPHNPLDKTSFTKTPSPNKYKAVIYHFPSAPKFVFNERRLPHAESAGPGAAAVNIRRPPGGKKYSLQPLPKPITPSMITPGPDAYEPNYHSIDPNPIMKTIATRLNDPEPEQRPPPNAYDTIKHKERGQSITFRPFEPVGDFRTPAPNSYWAEKYPKKIPPEYSFGDKPVEYLDYRDTYGGPGALNIRQNANPAPTFKFNGKPEEKIENTPAPNAYSPRGPITTRKGFSIAGLPPKWKPETIPAPNAYFPKSMKPRAPAMSMGIKHHDVGNRELEMVPSPAHYDVGKNCVCATCRKNKPGFSFRGRVSKFVYSGYDIGRNLDKLPAYFENTRKTIT